jgi:uncharacterized protein (UPF0332 family)
MKEQSLFKKLSKEGKLQLVEPSEDIKESYMKKSESNLDSSKILLDKDKLEESVSLTYYSMYYMTLALFFKAGIKCENHSAVILLVKRIFDLDNSSLSFAKKERVDKQYYIDFHIVKEDVTELIRMAESYNAMIFDFMERLSSEQIALFRKKMSKLLSR